VHVIPPDAVVEAQLSQSSLLKVDDVFHAYLYDGSGLQGCPNPVGFRNFSLS
jgi:hypothetical protein